MHRAETSGDQAGMARLRAMEGVIGSRLIAVACPEAVVIAGDAAKAAFEGQSEPEWYAKAFSERGSYARGRFQLDRAIRLLRMEDLWPWA